MLNHRPKLAAHPGGRKLYYRIKRNFYWPALAVDCYATVRNCPECARNRIKLRKNVGELTLFPANAPLESVCIDLLGELMKTPRGNRYLFVITDRFTKLVRTVPLKGISAFAVAQAFVTHWVFNYEPPVDLIADNGRQFTSKFFQDVCHTLNVHNAFTTTYHPQTNGQVERFNRTILSALRAYIQDHPKDWDLHSDAITFAYNCQPQTSTSLAPFELVLSRPPGPIALKGQPSEPMGTSSFKEKWKAWLTKGISETRERLKAAQDRYKRNYDKRLRRDIEDINPGDQVYLSVERREEKESRHKLAAIAEGPFKVKDVNKPAKTVVIEYPDRSVENVSRSRVVLAPRGNLPKEVQQAVQPLTIQDTILDYPVKEDINASHIQRMTTTEQLQVQGKQLAPPEPLEKQVEATPQTCEGDKDVDTDEYVIDEIVDTRVNKSRRNRYAKPGETLYRVRWYGYEPDDDTWEPTKHLPRSKILAFCKKKGLPIPSDIDTAMNG